MIILKPQMDGLSLRIKIMPRKIVIYWPAVWVIIWSPQWKSVLCDAYHFEINRCPYCSTVTGWWMPSSKPNFFLSYNNRRYYYFQLISHVSANHQMPEWCTISIEKFSPTFHNMQKSMSDIVGPYNQKTCHMTVGKILKPLVKF